MTGVPQGVQQGVPGGMVGWYIPGSRVSSMVGREAYIPLYTHPGRYIWGYTPLYPPREAYMRGLPLYTTRVMREVYPYIPPGL